MASRNKRFDERFKVMDMNRSPKMLEEYLGDKLKSDLTQYGAVLLRNTGIDKILELERCARLFLHTMYETYVGGAVPRRSHSRFVFSPNELNSLLKLPLHNELAYQPKYPRHIGFFCNVQSRWGGETPVAHDSDVQSYIDESLRRELLEESVVYTRRYVSSKIRPVNSRVFSGMLMTWQDAFNTEGKAEVEEKCRVHGLECSWHERDVLKVSSTLPVYREHPDNGRQVFFNQLFAHSYSPQALGKTVYWLHRLMGISYERAPRNSELQSSGRVSRRLLDTLASAYEQASVEFRWREGDWMILDNLQVAHGRNPFYGKRVIWVVMGD